MLHSCRFVLILAFTLMLSAPLRGADIEQVAVFQSGQEGYHTFRIPAIVKANDGALLAFAEGRKNGGGDHGDIDVVLKRSTDGGKTWGPLEVVLDTGDRTSQNPAPVVDRRSGDVLLLTSWNTPGHSERDVRQGKEGVVRSVWMQRSRDHGRTWSDPVEITASTKRDDWRWYATGPVHGIQLERGKHAGRLVVPCDHSTDAGTSNAALGAHAIYSDDGGKTWQIGAVDAPGEGVTNPNETTVVELVDGRLYFNTRNQHGSSKVSRAVAYSRDGGESFEAPFAAEPQIAAPVVQASVARIRATDQGDDRNLIVFAGPMHPSQRRDMTLRYSVDETETWHTGPQIHAGPSAYSDVLKVDDQTIGVLYEGGERNAYQTITFARVPIETLEREE